MGMNNKILTWIEEEIKKCEEEIRILEGIKRKLRDFYDDNNLEDDKKIEDFDRPPPGEIPRG